MTAALLDAPVRIHRPTSRLAAAAVPALEPWQVPAEAASAAAAPPVPLATQEPFVDEWGAEAPRRPLLRYLILAAAMAAAPLAMLASAALGSM